MDLRLTTYKDLTDHLIDFLGSNPGGDASRDARRAVQSGYRDLASRHNWSYFYSRGRVLTNAVFTDGSIAYTASTRRVVLTPSSSTGWPAWAAQGSIVLSAGSSIPGNMTFKVATRLNDTTLVLTQASGLEVDLDIGTSYTLFRDTYPLPVDCQSIDRMILINNAYSMQYEHPSTWLERQRLWYGPAAPRTYTLRGSPDYFGALAVSFFPAPDAAYVFDFIYHRRPRPLIRQEVSAGTVTVASGLPSVTGAGTAFDQGMVGAVLRISAENKNMPTGLAGSYPALFERLITEVTDENNLTVDASFDQDLGPVKYVISDPVDLEETAMLTGLLRSCENQLAKARNMKNRLEVEKEYKLALIEAMEADSRNFSMESSGASRAFPYRLAQMPRGPDVS